MNNPFFWLGVSILLVAISLMALLTVAIFTLQELARAARSAEKLLDTLNQELPTTLRDLRLTGQDLSGLTDEVAGSVQSARSVVEQVDKGLTEAKVQAQKAQITTRSLLAGATAAFQVLTGKPRRRRRPPTRRPPILPVAVSATTSAQKRALATQPDPNNLTDKATPANSQKPDHTPATQKNASAPAPAVKTATVPVTQASTDSETTD